jgi:tripartite-type tricarboxylate transporter receptor subunit TctC
MKVLLPGLKKMYDMKRWLIVLLTICIATTAFAGGGAEGSSSVTKTSSGWPNRPIEIIAPADPGTGTDVTLRAISPYLEKYLGVSIMIVNEPAANGEIALNRVAKLVRADGYTWGYWNIVGIASRCAVGNLKGRVDPFAEYVWAGGNYFDPNTIITRKNGSLKSLDDIVNAAKANPGGISWGRMGPISQETIYINFIEERRGVKLNPIDSLEGSNGITAVMGGHLDVVSDNLSSSLQMYLDGSIEIIGVGGDERVPEMPNVPTFKEQGYDFPIQSSERHFYGPAKIDKEIVDFFRDAVKKAAADPAYIETCRKLNLRPWYADADTSLRNVQRYMDTWKSIVN